MGKIKFIISVLVFSYYAITTASGQCGIDAGQDIIITCGGNAQLNAEPKWVLMNSGTTNDLLSLYFTDSNTGYAAGAVGTILKTIDSGTNWVSQTSGSTKSIKCLSFFNSQIGYAFGGEYRDTSTVILKTTNGGTGWTKLPNTPLSFLNYSICFVNKDTGYIAADSSIYKTIDGGLRWSCKCLENSFQGTNYGKYGYFCIRFIDSMTGYIAGSNGSIYKTINGADLWTTQTSGTDETLKSIFFLNENLGYIVGEGGTILKTTNGGANWVKQTATTTDNLNCVFFVSSTTGYIVGANGTILKTINGGDNWVKSASIITNSLNSIFFTNSNTGYIAGNGGTLLKLSLPDSYSWSPTTGLDNSSISNPIVSTSETTSYEVTTNSNGCIAKDTIKVIVKPLTANAGTDKTIVCGGTAQLNTVTTNYIGTGTLKYKWTPSTGLNNDTIANPTAKVINDITYTVTVTTPNGCTATDTINVIVNFLTANAGTDKTIICGGTAQLNTVTTNYTGTGTLKFNWTPTTGLNNDTIANPTAKVINDITYTVTVTTPNGCTATDTIKVTVNSLTANAGTDKTIVCGGTAQLNTVATNYTGTGTLKYKWTPSTGLNNDTIANPTAKVINDITYTVTVTTPNGCTATDTIKVTVNSLTANAGTDKTIVCGGTAQLNTVTTNYTGTGTLKYKWTPTTGLNNDTIANPTATLINDVTYTVTVTTPNGCTASDNVVVNIMPMEKPEIGIVGVNSFNKNMIVWNKTVSTGIESYYIYRETNVTDVYEKIGTVSYDSLSIFVDNQSFPDIQSNKYKMSIFDRHGLESPQSNPHKTMHLSINKGLNTTWNLIWESYEGFTVSTYNIYRGTTVNNLSLIGTTSGNSNQYSDISAPAGDVDYQLEVINPNPVNPSKASKFIQKSKDFETSMSSYLESYSSSRSNIATNVISGLDLTNDNKAINIYPNPVTESFRVYVFTGKALLIITDINGIEMLTKQVLDNESIFINNFSKGMYIVKIITNEGTVERQLIKK